MTKTKIQKGAKLRFKTYKITNLHFIPCFFIGVFNFLGLKLVVMQNFVHSCVSFLDFLGHVIHFYKYA